MDILKRLFNYVRPYWKTLLVTSVLMTLRSGLNLLPPLFHREIVDHVIGDSDLSRLLTLIVILVIIHILLQITSFGDMYIRHVL
ncbi:MAG: ABC transporter ATP-binding protein, partial [Chloroflexi bacterium]|nr:ABC transporter ATP-binding protein [Chloroflexota bacterium]